jgi:tetratricopeptide (TPR) repeat protein
MEKALLLDPSYPYPYYGLGLWYEKMPRWAGGSSAVAKVFYERAARLAPYEIFMQLAYARTCSTAGLKDEAIDTLRQAINQAPQSYEDQRRLRTAAALLTDIDPDTTTKLFSFEKGNLKQGKGRIQNV